MNYYIPLAVVIFAAAQISHAESPSVYEMTLQGKNCFEDSSQVIHCTYEIGKTLRFSIDGVGLENVGITFTKSDFDGDFYASYGLNHGCVIVKPSLKGINSLFNEDFAFVSPKSGKVYDNWSKCASGH